MDDRLVTEITDQEIKEMYDRIVAAGTSDIPQNSDPQPVPAASDDQELVDNYGFPFEPEGIYNSAMLDFEEVAEALWGLILQTHYCATRYHRLSPNYTLLMQILEKHIRQMGSYCITQAVLEQSGHEFRLIKGAELKELCGMVSLHFRKCCRAYNTIYSKDQCQDLNMMKWIFRWAALFERLKATQEKIDKIKSGKLKIETLLETQNVYKDEPRMRRDHSDKAVDPRLKASAMPIMTSYTSEVKLQKKAEEKRERALKREAERAKKRFEKKMDRLPRFGLKEYPPIPFPKIPGIGLDESELRKLLMDEAKSRLDMAEAGLIAREPLDRLIERFKKLSGQGSVAGGQWEGIGGQEAGPVIPQAGAPPRFGPSEETHRKLREKRKKKR